ncbi:MAG TPA: ATP phosphoribosyltransferase regulatory subunit, partial [Gemmatimonadaceae bacterium]|nr:ATP phosphoribosyltransferase regulatory subunit [Gemmatimonadaceae bacterium]
AALLDSVAASDLAGLRAAFRSDPAVTEGVDRIERYLALVAAHGLRDWVRFDLSIVRGLAYYTGIVFELFDRQGEFRAICGGGRYDTLLRDLGGVEMPALGFGMGDVVLGEVLRARGLLPADVEAADFYVAAESPVTDDDVIAVATALRHAGARVEYAFHRGPLGRQRKAAWTAQVGYIVELHATDEGLRLHVRDSAGAGLMSAVTNEPTLGERVGDTRLALADLLKILRAHPKSIRPDFAPPARRP